MKLELSLIALLTAALPVLTLRLADSPQSLVLKPAFVVMNWGAPAVKLIVNGMAIPRGKVFRFGPRQNL